MHERLSEYPNGNWMIQQTLYLYPDDNPDPVTGNPYGVTHEK